MADAQPQLIAVKDQDGTVGTVDASEVPDALQQGFTPATPEEYQAAQWKAQHETTGQEVATGAEGFAQGLIPGAATLESKILPQAGSIEEQRARREVNPGIRFAGQLAGNVAQGAAIAAGAGALSAALAPAAEASEAVAGGTAAADAAAAAGGSMGAASGAADAAATEAAPTLAQALLGPGKAIGYASQGLAGAAQMGTGYINEAELGDHDFHGEVLAQEMGLGALFGVGAEAGINVLGEKVLPPVLRKADDLLDSAGQKFKGAFTTLSDKVNTLEPGTTANAWDAIFSGAKRPGAKIAEDIADGINDAGDMLQTVGKAHELGFRPDEAAKNLIDVPAAKLEPHLTALSNRIDQALGQVDQTFGREANYLVKPIAEAKSALDAAMSEPGATAAAKHEALLTFKQDVGDALFAGKGVANKNEAAIESIIKRDVWGAATDNLRDGAVWGDAQAGRNAALDAATRQKINAAKQVAKDFGAGEINLDSGKRELYIKPSKVLSALKGDPLANQERLTHLADYVEASKNYLAEVKNSAGTAGAVVPGGDDLHDLLETITASRKAGEAYKPVEELLRRARTQPPVGLGAIGAAPLLGGVAHAAGVSIPGAAALAAPVAAMRSPVKAMQTFAKIASSAAVAKAAIGTAVRKVFSNAPARTAITGAALGALRGRTLQSVNGASAGADFSKQAKHISELAADPQRQIGALATNTSRISQVAPATTAALHGAASRGLDILAQAVPKNPSPSALPSENKEWQPNGSQLAEWNELHAAILKPSAYLGKLQDGTASPAVWSALQQAYPAWTKEVATQTMDHIATHPKLELTQGQKLAASMILGSPVSPTVAPDQIAFQQQAFAASAPQPPDSGKSSKAGRMTQHGLDHLDLGARSELGGTRPRRAS